MRSILRKIAVVGLFCSCAVFAKDKNRFVLLDTEIKQPKPAVCFNDLHDLLTFNRQRANLQGHSAMQGFEVLQHLGDARLLTSHTPVQVVSSGSYVDYQGLYTDAAYVKAPGQDACWTPSFFLFNRYLDQATGKNYSFHFNRKLKNAKDLEKTKEIPSREDLEKYAAVPAGEGSQ